MARNRLATLSTVESTVKAQGIITIKFSDDVVQDVDSKTMLSNPEQFLELPYVAQCTFVHGLRQKLADSYAGSAEPSEARESLQKVLNTLFGADGEPPAWSTKREGRAEGSIEKLARAVVAAFAAADPPVEKDFDTVVENLKKKDVVQRNITRKVPEIRLELAKMEANAKTSLSDVDL